MKEPIYKGIDVSYAQENKVNWQQVYNSGVRFVMIRAGFGTDAGQQDSAFCQHITGALAVGLKVGVYWMSYSCNAEDAVIEGNLIADMIAPYMGKIEFPVAFDFEGDSLDYIVNPSRCGLPMPTKEETTSIARAFCDTVKRRGYLPCLYTNYNFIKNHFDLDQLADIPVWLAFPGTSDPEMDAAMWQNQTGETGGFCPGVSDGAAGLCDNNVAFVDFPALIAEKGLNFLNQSAPVPMSLPVAEQPQQTSYVVQDGDTMSGIADAYDMSLQALASLNPNKRP